MSRIAPGVPAQHSARFGLPGARSIFWFLATLALGVGVPAAAFTVAHQHGWELSTRLYPILLGAAIVDLVLTLSAGIAGLRPTRLPETPGSEFGTVIAIVRAEQEASPSDVRDTVAELISMRYVKPIHVVLAYSHPAQAQAVEGWADIAAESTTLTLLPRAEGSRGATIRTLLELCDGEMMAIFDAGQHPIPGCFGQAWLWLSHGYDAVHGGRAISNGDCSHIARLAAVDLQTATSCPLPITAPWDDVQLWCEGGTFMRVELARELASDSRPPRTSSYRVIHDRHLISWQPGPTSLRELWNFHQEDDLAHLRVPGIALWSRLRAGRSRGARLALFDGVIWKPLYVWLSLQAFTIAGFEWWRHGNTNARSWLPGIALLLVLTVVPAPPLRTFFAFLAAGKEHRLPRRWYLQYLFASWAYYASFQATSLRVAQLRLIAGRRTPRHRISGLGVAAPEHEDTVAPEIRPPTTAVPGTIEQEAIALQLRIDTQEAELAELRNRLDALEARQRAQEDFQRTVAHISDGPVSSEDTATMVEILSDLQARPDQLIILASLSQRAATLDDIVQTYGQLHEALTAGANGI